ncbi:hypothetical protein [Lactococcus phage P1048]|uniref:Uncharacterized protein n=1 Tax=Lactococcus phage P1048 TaxID=2662295 RepID=A0A649V2B9_9CAUD|nr:hypothetical protein H1Z36_gp144 [Lactococcus phage P1048]QGJ84984.1 hypothetical protein [Lactococcus phage P1048]
MTLGSVDFKIKDLVKSESDNFALVQHDNLYQVFEKDSNNPFIVYDDETKQLNYLNKNVYSADNQHKARAIYEKLQIIKNNRTF